jgi:hypothetical protein
MIYDIFVIITIYSTPCYLRECIISFYYLLIVVVISKPLFDLTWHIIILIGCYLSKTTRGEWEAIKFFWENLVYVPSQT